MTMTTIVYGHNDDSRKVGSDWQISNQIIS